jgi:MtN3 and saliva related transmembrane protein
MNSMQLIGIGAGILTSSSLLPQLIKMFREKKAEDVSVYMLLILLAGLVLWVVYGILKKDIPIIATNSFSFLINTCMIVLRFRYAANK